MTMNNVRLFNFDNFKNLKYTFLSDMKIVLNEYLPTDNDNQYNDELLIEVLNIAEEYFINKDKTEREVYYFTIICLITINNYY